MSRPEPAIPVNIPPMIPVKNNIALTFGQSGTFILIGRSLARFNRYRAYANEAHVETKKILAYAGGNLFAIYLKLIIIPRTPPDVTYRIVVLSLDVNRSFKLLRHINVLRINF